MRLPVLIMAGIVAQGCTNYAEVANTQDQRIQHWRETTLIGRFLSTNDYANYCHDVYDLATKTWSSVCRRSVDNSVISRTPQPHRNRIISR